MSVIWLNNWLKTFHILDNTCSMKSRVSHQLIKILSMPCGVKNYSYSDILLNFFDIFLSSCVLHMLLFHLPSCISKSDFKYSQMLKVVQEYTMIKLQKSHPDLFSTKASFSHWYMELWMYIYSCICIWDITNSHLLCIQ